MGDLDFGSPTGQYFREEIQAPWFAFWLKGKGKLDLAEATLFEGGSNRWRRFDTGRRRRVRSGSSTSAPADSSRSTRRRA